MKTFTFYSYKGGTGRTLAVANAARFLVRGGEDVFVLDFDLEAPGLPYKLGLPKQEEGQPRGLVDLLLLLKTHPTQLPELNKYVHDFCDGLRFMPAGNAPSAEYTQKLTELDLPSLFNSTLGTVPAASLFETLKTLIEKTYHPRYLLIDSRTGATEIAGAALQIMPDVAVFLALNNKESRIGARKILRAVKRSGIETVLAISRLPEMSLRDESRLLRETLRYFNEPAAIAGDTLDLKKLFILHSEPELEKNEQIRVDSDTTANDSILLRDYWRLFRGLGLHTRLPLATQTVLKQLTSGKRSNSSPLIGGYPPRDLRGRAVVSMERRVRTRKSLKVVAPVYCDQSATYSHLVSCIQDQLLAAFAPNLKLKLDPIPPDLVHFDLLTEHVRDGVFDFFGDPFYLTPNRAHLVDIVQLGWCPTYTLFAQVHSPIQKRLREIDSARTVLDCLLDPFINKQEPTVGVLGDTPAASEANRLLSRYLTGSALVSKGSEEDLLDWLHRNNNRNSSKIIVCDHVVAQRLGDLSASKEVGFNEPAIILQFEERVPAGFVYPREDRQWRRVLSKAIAYGLLHFLNDNDWDEQDWNLGRAVELMSLEELRLSLLSDMTLEEAAHWNSEIAATIGRTRSRMMKH